jgi:glucose-6-phosphate 1-epimerase
VTPADTAPPVVVLRSADCAVAEVHGDGAHVTSWKPAPDGEERLFLSARTELREGAAIRGGIPVIFPQFATEGPLPRHGFARTTRWALAGVRQLDDGAALATFRLRDSEATRAIWPASFVAHLSARVDGRRLVTRLSVKNTGDAPIQFTAALHTYLRVGDIGDVVLEGLQGRRFRESAAPGVLRIDESPALRPEGEVDRVYVNVDHPLLLREPDRALAIEATGFPDVVVWNPGAAKAAALSDMEPGGERRMLCVEAGAVQRPVIVAPGDEWHGEQMLSV